MVSSELLDRDALDDEEWFVTPTPEDLVPDSIAAERTREQFRSALRKGRPITLTHTDADGLSAAALLEAWHGPRTTQPIDYSGPYQFVDALEDILDVGVGAPITIADFAIDDDAPIELLEEHTTRYGCQIRWFDHHQWDAELVDELEAIGVEMHVDADECATSLIEQTLEHEFPEHLQELAAVTKDIDLWIRDDPRSGRLNALARQVDDPEDYVAIVREFGVDWPAEIDAEIDTHLETQREYEQAAIDRLGVWPLEDANLVVATTYTAGGRSSEIGNAIVEEGAGIAEKHVAGANVAW